ncbi:Beta-N-acetylhexosaminidase [Opitutus terrae PB90-1]|uniref:Beta-N-acetylhexosaminidase n=2 Tax=Opitutus terrae TaxID=107709 RepID=B1ZXS1_OPITP|nr:Beta-N-acetylhexosaminidase [Opitutus terrae PB90-1]
MLLAMLAVALPVSISAAPAPHDLLPAPAQLAFAEGRLPVTAEFSVSLRGHDDARLRAGLSRALRRWEERTGFTFARTPQAEFVLASDTSRAALVVECSAAGSALPTLGEDESYSLEVSPAQAVLRAPNVVGALRGFETLLQLLQRDARGWFVPVVKIQDAPRFPWRGLMIDVCRHWQPMEVLKRNLDGMALVKLNVLHLHLTEDQGFRIESKTHPRLHELGSDGLYFTQDQIREIIAYAAARGIRVVPEFDMPGHATSWAVAYPELASAPGPYVIERGWGIFDPVLDPTNEKVYALLEDFLGEMAALFPDPYLHIGGDENNGKHWNANARIQAFIREHDLKDNEGLHATFNRRVRDILTKHGKKMVGWDEILHPDLPQDAIVHSWRGPTGLAAAAKAGHAAILSNGYYIDLCYSAADHYRNDPLPADTAIPLAEQSRILGGEATMWAEWVSPETIDSRIWPRTAAIAERLWSPRDVNDVADMYRRLAIVSQRLEETGLNHERNRPAMLRRLAGDGASAEDLENLRIFVEAVEPVKGYERGRYHAEHRQATPLTRVADCARPESNTAREFTVAVDRLLGGARRPDGHSAAALQELREQLLAWQAAGLEVADLLTQRALLGRDSAPVAKSLAEASAVGLAALEAIARGDARDPAWRTEQFTVLERAAEPHDAVQLPALGAIRRLVTAAAP